MILSIPPSVPCEYCGADNTKLKFDFGEKRIYSCDDCRNSFTYPQPSSSEFTRVYGENYFSNEGLASGAIDKTYGYQNYEKYKEDNLPATEKILSELTDFFDNSPKGKSLLDFGCGLGFFLKSAFEKGFEVQGIECNEFAAKAIEKEQGFQVHAGTSLDDLVASGSKYDVIVMLDVVEHLLDPGKEIANCYELLSDKGILLIGTTDFDHPIPRLLGSKFEDFRRVHEHLFFFGKKNLISMIEMSGFKNIKTRSQNIYLPLNDLFQRLKGMGVPGATVMRRLCQLILLSSGKKVPVNFGIKYYAYFTKKILNPAEPETPASTLQSIRINVVIPVYNEEKTIEKVIEKVLRVKIAGAEISLVIVDDGSTDCTRILLRELQKKHSFDLYLKPHNEGKGSALKVGFKHCDGDIIIIQDADLEYDPEDYGRLIEPIRAGDADVVYGSRFLSPERRVMGFWHTYGNKFLTFLCNMLINLNITDMETCYKVIKTDVAKSLDLRSKRFDVEPEMTCKLARKNMRIYEVPIKYHARTYKEGKKIGLKDLFQALWAIFKFGVLKLN